MRVGKHVDQPAAANADELHAPPTSPASRCRTSSAPTTATSCWPNSRAFCKTLGFHGIVVLVDRVDEPHLINGSVEQMRALLWPMLDNKFLKHPGIGFKLLLPIELSQFIDREDRDFYQRARLDKQNMIPSLEWTGEALYDVAIARLKACACRAATPSLRDLFDDVDHRAPVDGRLSRAARAAAPVQIHVPAVRRALQRLHRRRPVLEDLERAVRIDAGTLQPRPGRLRPRDARRLRPAAR